MVAKIGFDTAENGPRTGCCMISTWEALFEIGSGPWERCGASRGRVGEMGASLSRWWAAPISPNALPRPNQERKSQNGELHAARQLQRNLVENGSPRLTVSLLIRKLNCLYHTCQCMISYDFDSEPVCKYNYAIVHSMQCTIILIANICFMVSRFVFK